MEKNAENPIAYSVERLGSALRGWGVRLTDLALKSIVRELRVESPYFAYQMESGEVFYITRKGAEELRGLIAMKEKKANRGY